MIVRHKEYSPLVRLGAAAILLSAALGCGSLDPLRHDGPDDIYSADSSEPRDDDSGETFFFGDRARDLDRRMQQ